MAFDNSLDKQALDSWITREDSAGDVVLCPECNVEADEYGVCPECGRKVTEGELHAPDGYKGYDYVEPFPCKCGCVIGVFINWNNGDERPQCHGNCDFFKSDRFGPWYGDICSERLGWDNKTFRKIVEEVKKVLDDKHCEFDEDDDLWIYPPFGTAYWKILKPIIDVLAKYPNKAQFDVSAHREQNDIWGTRIHIHQLNKHDLERGD